MKRHDAEAASLKLAETPPARPLRLQPQLAHDGEHPFLADDDAVAPELAVDPAVPVAALVLVVT